MPTRTSTTIAKWGNSTGIRIPRKIAEQAKLHAGDSVELEVEGPGVVIIRAPTQKPTLNSLLSRITAKNRHEETDWGKPEGDEIG